MLKHFKLLLTLSVFSVFILQVTSCGSGDDDEIPTDDGLVDCLDPAKLTPPVIKEIVEGNKVLYVHCTGSSGDFYQIEVNPEPKQAAHFDVPGNIVISSPNPVIRVEGLQSGILYKVRAKSVISCNGTHFSDWTDGPGYKLCIDSPAWSDIDRAALLAEVNDARDVSRSCDGNGISEPTTPLRWNYLLEEAAMIHTEDMVKNGFFAHQSATDGSSPQDRTARVGYGTGTGENIARGKDQYSVIEQWLASPGHCLNIMSPRYGDLGLAGDLEQLYFTQLFGLQ